MSIQERHENLLNEAKALIFFFNLSSDKLIDAFKSFDDLYASKDPIDPEQFSEALHVVDAEIEDLCIARKITQDRLEELMENNFSYKSVTIE